MIFNYAKHNIEKYIAKFNEKFIILDYYTLIINFIIISKKKISIYEIRMNNRLMNLNFEFFIIKKSFSKIINKYRSTRHI